MKTLIIIFIETNWYSLDIDNFDDFNNTLIHNSKNTLVTFQTSDLIREIKSKEIKSLPKIIDLESFDKQMSQEGKEFRNYSNWKALNFLKHHKEIDSEFKLTKENIKSFLEKLSVLYNKLLNKDKQELKRFNELEIDINKLIYKRQKLGVRINLEIAKERCKELEKLIYTIKNNLQLNYNIFTPDNIKSQKKYLDKKKYKIIKSYLYTFKIYRNTDKICNLYYELLRNKQDLNSLLFIVSQWGGMERTYPSYFGFGTITSRIVQRQPSLQNLRKTNRDIIIPDTGMRLLYVDYSQFEAGILASLSNDETLIELYNSDIYSDLAEKVLNNKEDRNEAKILFYRYMYGDNSLKKEAKAYFKKFVNLEIFKISLEDKLLETTKIGTEHGNYRYALDENNTWALSHIVQSTASYIYKKALIEVQNNVKSANFLIPMHDGTVYQINKSEYEKVQSEIEKIYKEEFKKVCPQIEPRLNCKDKFE
jgi:DNA polymerase I-like protein with 3'-5' exonuclease and polymerase domains